MRRFILSLVWLRTPVGSSEESGGLRVKAAHRPQASTSSPRKDHETKII